MYSEGVVNVQQSTNVSLPIRSQKQILMAKPFASWGPFLESPETFREHFGWHNSLCIFKTKATRGTKLSSNFSFYSFYNILKDQLDKISGSEFDEWLFGPEKFSGLSRNGPLALV